MNLGPRFAPVQPPPPSPPVPVPGPAMRARTSLSTVCIFSINADSAGVGGRASARAAAPPRAPPRRGVPNSRIRDAGRVDPSRRWRTSVGAETDPEAEAATKAATKAATASATAGEEGRVDESAPPGPRHEKDPSSAGDDERRGSDARRSRDGVEDVSSSTPSPGTDADALEEDAFRAEQGLP